MARLAYAVSGEGLGHAARARTLVEELAAEHEVLLYAPGQAYEMLAPCASPGRVEVRAIPGLRFRYSSRHRLDYVATGAGSLGFLRRFPGLIRRVREELEEFEPDAVLCDFEPTLPRAAKPLGVPVISLDHQHFLETYDLGSLPARLRWYARLMGLTVPLFVRGQDHTIVSSFYFPPLRPGLTDVTQIGVLLRREIRHARPENGEHLLAYLRRFSGSRVLEVLSEAGCEVRVYGLGERPPQGNLRFLPVDVDRFAEDLARCRALVSTAGNQLIGEAQYLGKAVLAMPEPGNHEQEINGHFLARSGAGVTLPMEQLSAPQLRRFLDDADHFAERIDRRRLCGNPQALALLQGFLEPLGVRPGNSTTRNDETEPTARQERPEEIRACKGQFSAASIV